MFQHLIQAIDDVLRQSQRQPIDRQPLFQFDNETVERLEDRTMLAGDVSVVQTAAGDLKLTGTGDSNQVQVAAGGGIVTVSGLLGTTVNGFGTLIVLTTTPNTIDRNLIVNMKGGDDYVEVDDLQVGGDVRIKTGSGDDTVGVIDTFVLDDLTINTSSGADVTGVVDVFVVDRLSIVAGSGPDAIGLATCDTVLGRTKINTGSGADGLFLAGTYNDRLTVNMGSDADVLAIAATAGGGVTKISLGGGDDQVFVDSSTSMPGGPRVNGGGGNDTVEVHFASTFLPDFSSVENPFTSNTTDTDVDNLGLAFAALYVIRGGDGTDLIC